MAANHNGLFPAWHEAWDVGHDNGLAKNGAVEEVANGAVGRAPHALQLELLHALRVRGDGRALDAHVACLQSHNKAGNT